MGKLYRIGIIMMLVGVVGLICNAIFGAGGVLFACVCGVVTYYILDIFIPQKK